ncbi:FecR domain-containing protein [Fulvivirga maritima]|uniref:FecR family protein n=1 Tax=Fulvivirga maritima TaxID=2904247 RepID=UPI001F229723|nr:FecR domain-containing protein [Fulvivirga maritima]UII24716.1 FecR domain-containing protein [Fulvivirga maritima]
MKNSTEELSVSSNEVAVNEVETPLEFSGKQNINLPDGSTILLNADSKLHYMASHFGDSLREVYLEGEGYFDIKSDKTRPFIVHTGSVNTKVLGTAFNIKAYQNSTSVEVTVTRGKVQVGDQKKTYGVITPNQQIKVNTETNEFKQQEVASEKVVAWKQMYIIMDDMSLKDAVAQLSTRYKKTIVLNNDALGNCHITGTFLEEQTLDHVLNVLCSVVQATYTYEEDGSVLIKGKGCK